MLIKKLLIPFVIMLALCITNGMVGAAWTVIKEGEEGEAVVCMNEDIHVEHIMKLISTVDGPVVGSPSTPPMIIEMLNQRLNGQFGILPGSNYAISILVPSHIRKVNNQLSQKSLNALARHANFLMHNVTLVSINQLVLYG